MNGKRVATLIDSGNKLEIEVYLTNGWCFCRYRHKGTIAWNGGTKPYKHTLGAIRGAYYLATGQV